MSKKHAQPQAWGAATKTILVTGALIAIAVLFSKGQGAPQNPAATAPALPLDANGAQIIEILARAGYSPRRTAAKAGVASIIRVNTQNTYDCSSALMIPALNYRTYLPPNGSTDIPVPAQEPGTIITGLCSMGMYSFSIQFE